MSRFFASESKQSGMALRDIQLIIKAPNQKIEDQTVECCSDWTVLQLKEHISLVYPLKPRVEEQRLIYSGHLLKNEQRLSEILESNDEKIFTIHMVCSQQQETVKKHSTSERNNEDSHRNEQLSSFLNTNLSALQWNAVPSDTVNGLNIAQPFLSQEQMMQQMAAMQQLYMQYMAQYLNQTGMNFDAIPLLQASNQTTTNTSTHEVNTTQVVRQPEVAGAQAQRMDAGPAGVGVDDDEDARNRDWLDWFYWLSRSLVFISILYFYSSLSRFVVVIGFGLLLYLYQNGFLNGNREEPRLQNVAEQQDAQRVQEMMDGNIDDHRRVSTVPIRATEERFSGLRLLWVMVSSLFTSLLPEQPAPVNLN